MLAGCDSLLAIAAWGRDPHAGAPVAQRLGFTRERTLCVATLHRVFRRVDGAAVERAVGRAATRPVPRAAVPGLRPALLPRPRAAISMVPTSGATPGAGARPDERPLLAAVESRS